MAHGYEVRDAEIHGADSEYLQTARRRREKQRVCSGVHIAVGSIRLALETRDIVVVAAADNDDKNDDDDSVAFRINHL